MRHIILVYSTFDVSGIQTQMLFLANAAVKIGIPVTIIALPGGLEALLDERVLFIEVKDYRRRDKEVLDYILENEIADPIIWASHPFELGWLFAVARRLARLGIACSTLVGVYHPRACFKPEDSLITEAMCVLNLYAAEVHQVYYMSHSVRRSHQARWGAVYKEHDVRPILMRDQMGMANTQGSRLRIVSIGRLVPWKAYNTSIPAIAKGLSAEGLDFVWDVYGDGPLLDRLRLEVTKLELGGRVVIHGEVALNDIDEHLSSADLFIGCGTSMLEAAMRKIPCIVTVDSFAWHCYGMLPDLPTGNIGEMQGHAPTLAITDLINEFYRLPVSKRQAIGDHCFRVARSQSLVPDAFARQLQALPLDQVGGFVKVFASAAFYAYHSCQRQWRLIRSTRSLLMRSFA